MDAVQRNNTDTDVKETENDKDIQMELNEKEVDQVRIGSLGIDSGGSFTKIVYFRPSQTPFDLPDYVVRSTLGSHIPGLKPHPNLVTPHQDGVIRFIKIPRHKYTDFIDFVQGTEIVNQFTVNTVNVTGGGAYRLAPQINQKLNIKVNPLNEFSSLIEGLTFLLDNCISEEVFTVDPVTGEKAFGVLKHDDCFPLLLASVGSGVSFLKITGRKQYKRVSGTSLGGGTFWGLCRLLTNEHSFDEVKKLSHKGKSENVDLLVGDIYGDDAEAYKTLGLSPDIIASSFGKAATVENLEPGTFKSEDVIRSLMFMIANNIGQIAFLNAKVHECRHIIFVGGFIEENPYVWSRFAYAINFWSEGKMKALFVRHEGYLGALGAMLHSSVPGDKVQEST